MQLRLLWLIMWFELCMQHDPQLCTINTQSSHDFRHHSLHLQHTNVYCRWIRLHQKVSILWTRDQIRTIESVIRTKMKMEMMIGTF
ncbi:hypothetical protein YC2023_079575 [Brassica napus]